MEFSQLMIIQAVLAALLVGMSKTALPGLAVLFVPLMASVFPAKASTGAVLPMLILADCFAVAYYRRHADWAILARLLPWVVGGIVAGSMVMDHLDNASMGAILGILVLAMVGLQFARQYGGEWMEARLPQKWWFAATMGVLAGFTTMLGNLAGPVMGIYLITMGLGKHGFIGTSAWFFLIVNLIKVPFSVNLGLIDADSLLFNAKAAPVVIAGVFIGLYAFKKIPQKWFNRAVLGLAALAGARLVYMYFAK